MKRLNKVRALIAIGLVSLGLAAGGMAVSEPAPAPYMIKCGQTANVHQQFADAGMIFYKVIPYDIAGGTASLFANPKTGRFAVLIYPEAGKVCMLFSGRSDGLKRWKA